MKWLIKSVENRWIKFLYSLDKEDGFIGMLLIMIISVTIFSILSSVHIYTINHARYQSGIREAFVMQVEIENFANLVADAYNQGRNVTPCNIASNCCDFSGIHFQFKKASTLCTPDDACLKSSTGKEYCLVKLEEANLSGGNAPIPSPTPLPLLADAQAEELRACLLDISSSCNALDTTADYNADCLAGSYAGNSLRTLCQKSTQHSYNTLSGSEMQVDAAMKACCNTYQMKTINCNDSSNQPSSCLGYETNTTLTGDQRIFCEICEMPVTGGSKHLFTYYVCPKIGGNTKNCTDNIKSTSTADDKAKSGVFYQTFRVLEH